MLYQCTSNFCPTEKKVKTRYQTTIHFQNILMPKTQSIFPLLNHRMGYGGLEFSTKSPSNELCDRIDANSTKKDHVVEIAGFQAADLSMSNIG